MSFVAAAFVLAAALPNSLPEKFAAMASNRTVVAEYRQERMFRGMPTKLVVRGSMAYSRGKGLVWITQTPIRTKTVITENSLLQWDGETGRVNRLKASDLPFVKTLFDFQSAWFGGNIGSLTGFKVKSSNGAVVELVADDVAAGALFSEIKVTFSEDGSAVREVEMRERSGDKMKLVFDKVKNNTELPDSIWECSQ